jgi:hypothetical protein
MNRVAASAVLLLAFAASPACAQRLNVDPSAPYSPQAQKEMQKAYNKAVKDQAKAAKKNEKAQRKAAKQQQKQIHQNAKARQKQFDQANHHS